MKKIFSLTALLALSFARAAEVPADLAASYEALRQATLKGDVGTIRSFYLPDVKLKSVDGQIIPLEVALQNFNPKMITFEKYDYAIKNVVLEGDKATVAVTQSVKASVNVIGDSKQQFESDALGEDVWQKVNGQWRVASSRVLESETRVGGQVVRQKAKADATADELSARRAALAAVARPISTLDPAAQNADFAWLGDLVEGATVLGAGEGSHGTAEHFQLKDRVFRELVTRHGFTVLALEDSYASGAAADRYVRGEGPDNADAATRKLEIGVWQTQEVRDLLKWMREYNKSRGTKPELRVVGVDMQIPGGSLALLADLAPQTPTVQKALAPLRKLNLERWATLAALPAAEYSALQGQIQALREAVESLPASTPRRAELVHLAETVRQGAVFWRGLADFNRANMLRDAAMGANTRFIFDQILRGQRGMLWAHNFHISKQPAQGQTYANLGQHLARDWGRRYRTLGFSFAGGELRAAYQDPAKQAQGFIPMTVPAAPGDSLDALIGTDAPAMYLPTAKAVENPVLKSWFAQPVGIAAVGALYTPDSPHLAPVNLPAAFDGVVFVKRSTPTKVLAPARK